MSPAPTDARRQDYWDRVEAAQASLSDVAAAKVREDGWTVHTLIKAGEADGTTYLIAIASQARDRGMILREGYLSVEDGEDPAWTSVHDRRVNGPLAQALLRGYARADNDRLGAEDVADPLLLDATGDAVEDDPAALTEPIGEHPDAEHYADEDRTVADADVAEGGTVVCEVTGETIPQSEAVNIGAALGVEKWVAKKVAGDDDA